MTIRDYYPQAPGDRSSYCTMNGTSSSVRPVAHTRSPSAVLKMMSTGASTRNSGSPSGPRTTQRDSSSSVGAASRSHTRSSCVRNKVEIGSK